MWEIAMSPRSPKNTAFAAHERVLDHIGQAMTLHKNGRSVGPSKETPAYLISLHCNEHGPTFLLFISRLWNYVPRKRLKGIHQR
ncbi:hypothetical protein I7I50_11594 [Histoplasma capsulatum G186AR]|uniref:Uncharacterized protein n=1 Tax=Ajellomyces capsulatus TaxID=5037 RepID=A0A8H8D7I3_AJECA|nr:hypothetical protein I7I52_02831 [Histoplasma capsulatum]QSS70084.1 hypothetical protein I7I50_11594 [Histoplasma capsulatum G186AR]